MLEILEKNDLKAPCKECIHRRVCKAGKHFEETKVETTHRFVKVKLECTEFISADSVDTER